MSGAVINTAFDEKAYQGDDFLGVPGKNLAMAGVTTGVSAVGRAIDAGVGSGRHSARAARSDGGWPDGAGEHGERRNHRRRHGPGHWHDVGLFDPTSWDTGGNFFGNMLEKGGLGMLSGGKQGGGWRRRSADGQQPEQPYLWSLLKAARAPVSRSGSVTL